MAHPEPLGSNRDISALWRARVERAKAAYDVAVADFRRLAEEYRDREMPRADSGFALRQAIAIENDARQRYAEVLRKFTDLIVNGTPPED